jgi:hypothetical protein
MEVSGELHVPAALRPGKKPGTHWIGGWVGPRAGLDFWRKEKSLAPTGIPTPDCQARSLVAIRTTLC